MSGPHGTWQTTGGGGGLGGPAVAVVLLLAGAVLGSRATGALAALGHTVQTLLITAAVILGSLLSAAAGLAVAIARYRRQHPPQLPPWATAHRTKATVLPPSVTLPPPPPPRAISARPNVTINVYGGDPATLAQAIRDAQGSQDQ